jgi:hypothetical protein
MGWATLCAGGVGSGGHGGVYRVWGCAVGGTEGCGFGAISIGFLIFGGCPKTRRNINVLRFFRFTKRTKTDSMACDFLSGISLTNKRNSPPCGISSILKVSHKQWFLVFEGEPLHDGG